MFVRTLLFKLCFYTSLGLWVIGLSVLCLIADYETIFRNFRRIALFVGWQVEHIAGIRLEFRGLENLPQDQAFIFSSKHGSTLDAVALFVMMSEFTALAKQEIFRVPFLGMVLRKMELFPINRQSGEAHKETPEIARSVVAKKRPLIVFPEGTRVTLGEERKLRSGAWHIREDVGIPVVTGASNAGYFWPAHSFMMRSGTAVFEIHPAMPEGVDKAAFMEELRRRIIDRSNILVEEARTQSGS